MSKKVVIISSSPRVSGNSDVMADYFAKGALEAGYDVEKINLAGKEIGFCKGCLSCMNSNCCVMHDDAEAIAFKMGEADVLVFATPIYYYEMSGQLKTMLDRSNPLYTYDYKFRDIYFLSSAAETEEDTPNRAVSGLEGWIECFHNAKLAGSVFAGGVTNVKDIEGHDALAKAFEMGKSI